VNKEVGLWERWGWRNGKVGQDVELGGWEMGRWVLVGGVVSDHWHFFLFW